MAEPDATDLTQRYQLEPPGPWRIAAVGEAGCSQPRCPRPAVIILERERRRRQPGGAYPPNPGRIRVRWGCCEQHSYGRVVIDGRIYFDRERFAR